MLDSIQKRFDPKALAVIVTFVALVFILSAAIGPQRKSTRLAVARTPVSLDKKESVEKAETNEKIEVAPSEVLWLARGIYSETKKAHEQELVAWVIRNRVETEYRGKNTYQEVVTDPWQFSAFNRNSPKRSYYSSLGANSQAAGFQTALKIAEKVAESDTTVRPFGRTTRHFYSERSMVGQSRPDWAIKKMPVKLGNVDQRRFRFYADVR